MRFTPSCVPVYGKESSGPMCSPSPKAAISSGATATALAAPLKHDDKASLPTNQLTTCSSSSSLKEQKGSVMTSIENHVSADTAITPTAIVSDAIADVPQAGIRKDESDKNGNSGKRVAKSVSVGNDENEERQTGETGDAVSAATSECSSGSAHQHHSLKLLKDFKILPKHASDPGTPLPLPTLVKDKALHPAPETRTIEVQCDGPDWTPVVLKSQIKNRLLKVGEKRKKKKDKADEGSGITKKSRNTGTCDAMASARDGKRKSGTKGAQHKLLSHKMPAVADPAAGCSTDCSKRLQAETASHSQVLSSHQHRQSSLPAASPCSSRQKQALVKSEEKKKRKDRISGEQENKCERKGKAAGATDEAAAVTSQDATGHRPASAADMPCPKATPRKVRYRCCSGRWCGRRAAAVSPAACCRSSLLLPSISLNPIRVPSADVRNETKLHCHTNDLKE